MNAPANPWYREPWPWLLASGPAAVVIAGVFTVQLALTSNDGLVADDYYKESLAINRTLERDAMARGLGLSAQVRISPGGRTVEITLQSTEARAAHPGQLRLLFAHPTRAGLDRDIGLRAVGNGRWEGAWGNLPAGHWDVTLESTDGWRLRGHWKNGDEVVWVGPGASSQRS